MDCVHVTPSGHRFDDIDIRRTVRHAVDLLDEFDPDHHPHLADRRGRLTRLIDGIDADAQPIAELTALLDDVWAEHLGAREDLIAAGALPPTASGTIAALHLGDGGVPKRPVESVRIDLGGVVGDRQGTRNHHGAPFQALCLWSAEVIDVLVAEGHPIAPGAAGENVTVSGLSWPDVTPGVRLLIGDALCEVSSIAVPCRQNARWFIDRRFNRIHHRHGPVSRMYATVLSPGVASVGDAVVLEP
jgi:hypothetical protein